MRKAATRATSLNDELRLSAVLGYSPPEEAELIARVTLRVLAVQAVPLLGVR
jgi:hypothetical protein